MTRHILLLFTSILLFGCTKQEKQENQPEEKKLQVLLIGSSHWNNYQDEGSDVAQTHEIDILSEKYQKELSRIADKIAEFNPDKIFVERDLEYQPELDSLYNLYKYSDWGKNKRNEIYQLGFRVANKLNHKRVYGIDYLNTEFPYDSVMTAMKIADQHELIAQFQEDIEDFVNDYDVLVQEKRPLMDIFDFLNNPELRKFDINWYLSGANKAGSLDNDIGSFLASEWIRRNIYSYGLLQKYVEEKDERIMILMGSSHIAVFENLISFNSEWETVELNEVVD